METILPSRVRLGAFELDLNAGELLGGEGKVMLQPQPFQVLLMLVQRRGEVTTREEIRKNLWPNDTVVEFDHAINTAIKKLRQALGDSAEKPKYIETVARRGYRLLMVVEWLPPTPTSPGVTPPAASPNLIGQKVSHYRVLEILGGGGMGVVYKAEDLKLGRRVALKFLPEELAGDSVALERFEREARAASALEHPNICPVYEFGEHEGQPFIAMQLLEGQTLRELIASPLTPGPSPQGRGETLTSDFEPSPLGREWPEGPGEGSRGTVLPLGQVLDIAIQIAEGLDAAHDKGIIHRDIKPANIFITTRGEVKILDFGLAKLTADSGTGILPVGVVNDRSEVHGQDARATAGETPALLLTRTGVKMGTAPYMSPEQVRGEKLDTRTDLFSFGLVLYEMATGQVAFAGQTVAEVHDAIINRTASPVRELNPNIPPGLDEIIGRALEKDREARFQTAAEMRANLKEVGAGLVPALGGHPRGVPLRRWPLWLAGSLALVVAGLGVAWVVGRRTANPPEVVERQLTANPFEDWVTGAAISPDGRYVAYIDQTGLYLRSIESGETHAVVVPSELRSRIWQIRWHPDGAKLLLTVFDAEDLDLWIVTVLGEAPPHLLYRNGLEPAISPDGRMIAFVRTDRALPPTVWVAGIDGEAPRKLAGEQQPVVSPRLGSPTWSPDGRWVAYVSSTKSAQGSWSSAIEVKPSIGGAAKTLVTESSLPKSGSLCYASGWPATCLSWSPDWRLVFTARRPDESRPGKDSYSLWDIPIKPGSSVVAGKAKRLAEWRDFYPADLSITSNGKRLSFLKNRDWDDVYLGELAPDGASMEAPRRFTLDDRGIRSLDSWTPDSQAILFSSDRNGTAEVFRQGLKESVAESLLQGPQDHYNAALSPDQSWMLYVESAPTTANAAAPPQRLMRQPSAGGSPEIVLQDPGGDIFAHQWDYRCPVKPGSPCVLCDVLGKENRNDIVFYSLDPVRGKGEQLGRIETDFFLSGRWSISPGGSRLALLDGEGKIDVLTFRDHNWHKVLVAPPWGGLLSIAWAADGKGFFASCQRPLNSFTLLHITLDDKAKPLYPADHRWVASPLPSPDGKYLAFDGETRDGNVWMLEGF